MAPVAITLPPCKPAARRRTFYWPCVAIAALLFPAAVVLFRLMYCLMCLAYCWIALTPERQIFLQPEPWHSSGEARDNISWPVPKIIHQTYKTADIPQHWHLARQTCLDGHHDYRYMFWTDQSARNFIAESYPWFLPTFDAYPHSIQRADALRYFALHAYGGVYLDLDVGCQWRVDALRQAGVTLPQTDPTGFSNDVMAAAPGHPFLKHMIEALPHWNHFYGTKYPTVMFSTGPMFLTMQFVTYKGDKSDIVTLPGVLYGGSHKAIFQHYRGSSWHGADSRLVFYLYSNLTLVLPVLLLGIGVVVACCLCAVARSKKRKCY